MKIKAEEIFELKDLNKKWKWVAKDKDGAICIYNIKPTKSKDCWSLNDECFIIAGLFHDLELDFGTNDWSRCIAERPIGYTDCIGKLGIFSDYEEKLNLEGGPISILSSIDNETYYKFVDTNGFHWKYFRPLTKEEIEQLTNYGE